MSAREHRFKGAVSIQPGADGLPIMGVSMQNTGPQASLSEEEKRKRLDAMVKIWQSDSERRIEREGYRAFIAAAGLDEYRYVVWLRFPEWERSAVVGQVVTLRRSRSGHLRTRRCSVPGDVIHC